MKHIFYYLFIFVGAEEWQPALCHRATVPCTCEYDISASDIFIFGVLFLQFDIQKGIYRLPFSALMACSIALHSALYRGRSQLEVVVCTHGLLS